MLQKTYITLIVLLSGGVLLSSCTTDPNSPGVEYMPDMYRSPAVEAYVDYGMDPWLIGEEEAAAQRNTISARKPVQGTIAYSANMELAMPYPLANTPEDYEKAGATVRSPLPLSQANLEAGQATYEKFCIHCHGEAGEGNGSITQAAGGKYPAVPSYQSRADLPDGKMYHTLMYGKGLMGSHASLISVEERWQVIQYVRTLMTGETPTFDETGAVEGEGTEETQETEEVEAAVEDMTADNQ